jgi:hypothetical protein
VGVVLICEFVVESGLVALVLDGAGSGFADYVAGADYAAARHHGGAWQLDFDVEPHRATPWPLVIGDRRQSAGAVVVVAMCGRVAGADVARLAEAIPGGMMASTMLVGRCWASHEIVVVQAPIARAPEVS